MRKRLIPILTLSILSLSLFSQNNKTEDVIYLKTGSVLRGKILPATNGTRIELLGGSVFVFQPSEIDSITKENVLKNKLKDIRTNYFRRDRGYRNITELGLIYGAAGKNTNSYNPLSDIAYQANTPDDFGISIHTVNGYQFWPYLFVGAGVGIDRFITYQQTFSPLYLRVSSEFLKRKFTPYVFCDAGYSVMWKQPKQQDVTIKNTGGLYVSAGAGIRIYTRSRASVMISLAYKQNRSQTDTYYSYSPDYTYTTKRTYQRLVMNIGVTF
ncbi:MAG: hypothetical protein JWO06_3287 [Bacteroidota bacterium]|nr:hypothetical protein [Bacteroidota bacterium]